MARRHACAGSPVMFWFSLLSSSCNLGNESSCAPPALSACKYVRFERPAGEASRCFHVLYFGAKASKRGSLGICSKWVGLWGFVAVMLYRPRAKDCHGGVDGVRDDVSSFRVRAVLVCPQRSVFFLFFFPDYQFVMIDMDGLVRKRRVPVLMLLLLSCFRATCTAVPHVHSAAQTCARCGYATIL